MKCLKSVVYLGMNHCPEKIGYEQAYVEYDTGRLDIYAAVHIHLVFTVTSCQDLGVPSWVIIKY